MTKDEALKLALEALETHVPHVYKDRGYAPITAIKEVLAQPPEERNFCPRCGKKAGKNDWDVHTCTTPQPKEPEQEPVAFYVYKPTLPRGHLGNVSDGDLPWVYDQDPSSGYSARMLVYTTPPQRTWVELTDEDDLDWEAGDSLKDLVKAIEAKLKEKNT